MENIFKDMTNLRFGLLVVISRAKDRIYGEKKYKVVMWNCICDCGNKKEISGTSLRNTKTKSCGCLRIRLAAERKGKRTGMKEYGIWRTMINRCIDKNHNRYHRYGGRGIKVCDRWINFDNFILDMGIRPTEKHSIDRIDNNGNYEPSNCKWSSAKEQGENRCNNRVITFNGETKILQRWADEIGINQSMLSRQIILWGIEKALTRKHNNA